MSVNLRAVLSEFAETTFNPFNPFNPAEIRPPRGKGQPLSFTLSFGKIPWFDEKWEIRRCDWLKRNP